MIYIKKKTFQIKNFLVMDYWNQIMYKKNILKNVNTFRENECLDLKESPFYRQNSQFIEKQ